MGKVALTVAALFLQILSSPQQMKRKTWLCRFEGRIVQQMIVLDGGTGKFNEITPRMLGIWETILKV